MPEWTGPVIDQQTPVKDERRPSGCSACSEAGEPAGGPSIKPAVHRPAMVFGFIANIRMKPWGHGYVFIYYLGDEVPMSIIDTDSM